MKKLALLIFLIILIVIFTLIWIQDEYGCPEEEGRDTCILNYITEKQGAVNTNICDEIQDPQNKDLCYFRIAEYKTGQERIALCNAIATENTSQPYHTDNCIFSTALAEKNPEFCDMISTENKRELCTLALT